MRLTDDPKTLAATKPDVTWTPDVQAVMGKALRRKSAERYQSAADFGRELYMAVEKMPVSKQMEAGTVVMGAAPVAGAATAVVSAPPPPTRVDRGSESTPGVIPTPAAVPAAKSKAGMFVGGGVAAAAALLATVYFTQTANKSGATPAPKDSVVTTVEAPVVQPSTPQPGSQSTQGTSELSIPNKPASLVKAPAQVSTPLNPTAPAGLTLEQELRATDKLAENPATAERALLEAERLSGKVSTAEDRTYLAIIKAQAYGSLSKDAQACDVLRAAKAGAAGTRREGTIPIMMASCQ